MLEHNKMMQQFLADNGIKATPKYLKAGSLKGTWRLYDLKQKWTDELRNKLIQGGLETAAKYHFIHSIKRLDKEIKEWITKKK